MTDKPLTDAEVEETRRNPYPPPWGQPNVNIAHLARDLQRARELVRIVLSVTPHLHTDIREEERKWRGE